jgi:hypothetical protein
MRAFASLAKAELGLGLCKGLSALRRRAEELGLCLLEDFLHLPEAGLSGWAW